MSRLPPFAFAAVGPTGPAHPDRDFALGVPGYTFKDLFEPERLRALDGTFRRALAAADPELASRFEEYRSGVPFPHPTDGDLLIGVGRHLGRFVATLFGVEAERRRLLDAASQEKAIFEMKAFIARRAIKKFVPGSIPEEEGAELRARVSALATTLTPEEGATDKATASDPELQVGRAVTQLLALEATLRPFVEAPATAGAAPTELAARIEWIRTRAAGHPALAPVLAAAPSATPGSAGGGFDASAALHLVRTLLFVFERWAALHVHDPAAAAHVAGWVSFQLPHKTDYDHLVPLRRPDPALPQAIAAPDHHHRRRDGFTLTDPRASRREVSDIVDYCLYCHERGKDSCSHGLREKDGSLKRNPLGVPLAGCPLDERISEMHVLRKEGESLGALAIVTVDNPMCPGTGHRICNDCMKACIYQKQEPVDIPQAETGVLTDVLGLPYGFEIYSLLLRWNPLHRARPYALPYNGKNVLVVGLGPAGYTLAQHLLNEGFGVVGIDGLKIEPPRPDLVGGDAWPPAPVKDWRVLAQPLDERILAGFGGVAEYGITVRWDKTFLTVMHVALERRPTFRIFGGVRFGGTLSVEDAFALGFDHVAIAAGAGKPTIIDDLKNNLIRGVRKASDFLMALQLQGAFKKDSLANLQVRLPALVIGGGLTGIDTTTELAAYYPVQVEKFLDRWEALAKLYGEEALWKMYDGEETEVAREFLEHGRAVRAERARAAAAGETPDVSALVQHWGGVALVYRKSLADSPAYRLNHEEVSEFLEEGVRFIERLSPAECVPDERGALAAVVFDEMVEEKTDKGARWRTSGQQVRLPARTLIVAAGTSPNVTYEKERPGTFEVDPKLRAFRSYRAVPSASGGFELEPVDPTKESRAHAVHPMGPGRVPIEPSRPPKPAFADVGFFTSYAKRHGGQTRFVTYYGDNHPVYAGSVVKAMASAKHGFPHVVRLFESELAACKPDGQAARDAAWRAFAAKLEVELRPTVHEVRRLTPTIIEIVVHAPAAARHFEPGQFFRLQNYEAIEPLTDGHRLQMEGLALTGAWVDKERGLLSMIVLEMGGSSRLVSRLRPGEPVVVMGPTGTGTEIPRGESVILCGGGLGNAVLFSIAKALKASGNRVLYFAAYKKREDIYKVEEIESATDQVIWSVDGGAAPETHRPQDRTFVGNVVQAMLAFANGELGPQVVATRDCARLIAIGSDRMMAAVKQARHGVLAPHLRPGHIAIASINSPMQCMMKEICAQCLQRWVDPVTGKESVVFSCSNQDQPQDLVDFRHLADRLRQNTVLEKVTDRWVVTLQAQISLPLVPFRHLATSP